MISIEKMDAAELKILLDETSKKIEASSDNMEINTIIEKLITSLTGSEYASLWSFDDQKVLLLRQRDNSSVQEISMLNQRGVLAECFFTLKGGIYNYLASEKEYLPLVDNPDDIRIKSKIILPLIDNEKLIGIITAYSSVKKIKNFDEEDTEILEALMPFLINVIYRMHPNMKKTPSNTISISKNLQKESSDVVEKVEEIKQARGTVETADETLNFLATTVHDIRTPANSLYGFLDLLEEQIDHPRLLQYVHNAKESAQFINNLTTSILNRISNQREQTESKPVQVNPTKFFSDIADVFSANMFNKKIHFNIYIDMTLPREVILETIRLKRIIVNLIGNAYKFTPINKTIDLTIEYKSETKRIFISVKDTGIGIAEEKQTEIFKAFKQAENDTYINFGGTGLGLSICAQYIKELGGELKLESELDTGSTFFFDIPVNVINDTPLLKPIQSKKIHIGILMDKQNILCTKSLMHYLIKMNISKEKISPLRKIAQAPTQMTHLICFEHKADENVISFVKETKTNLLIVEEELFSLVNNKLSEDYDIISPYNFYANTLHAFVSSKKEAKVLIVDDDYINIELIRAILEEEFCKIETAKDGHIALELLKNAVKDEEPFSLVYLDENMPKVSGMEVINAFRAFEKSQEIDAIFAVSISGNPDINIQTNSPFNSHVGKPFNKKEIKEILLKVAK